MLISFINDKLIKGFFYIHYLFPLSPILDVDCDFFNRSPVNVFRNETMSYIGCPIVHRCWCILRKHLEICEKFWIVLRKEFYCFLRNCLIPSPQKHLVSFFMANFPTFFHLPSEKQIQPKYKSCIHLCSM